MTIEPTLLHSAGYALNKYSCSKEPNLTRSNSWIQCNEFERAYSKALLDWKKL